MRILSSIGTRLNLIIILLLLVTSSVITGLNYYVARDSLETQLSEDMLPSKLDNIIGIVEKELVKPAAGLGVAVDDPFFREWIELGEPESGLDNLFGQLRNITSQFDTNGCNFVSNRSKLYYGVSNGERTIRDLGPQDSWFKDFDELGQDVLINVYVDDPDFGSTAFINRRIDKNGEYLGIISTAIGLDSFVREVTSMTIGKKGETYMVDKSGMVRLHRNRDFINQKRVSNFEGIGENASRMLSREQYQFHYTDGDGESWYVMSRFLPDLGWYLVTEANRAELLSGVNDALYVTVGIALLLLGTGVVVTYFFVRTITAALSRCVGYAESIASGDLNVSPDTGRKDELGRLQTAMSGMVGRLREVVAAVQDSASDVEDGGRELSDSSTALSQGATEQAASVEEVSSSMEEMTSNIHSNAENAKQTEEVATNAARDIEDGAKAVSDAVDSMESIAERITIIEEIARQTNLLALNAAIEAARAGEHGKGFAVVAAEVRKLAERSGNAAGEIVELSRTSTDTARKAGEMLERTVPEIRRTAELVQEISTASIEQSSGAEEVNKAIQELDKVIQQTASSSEEISATSDALLGKAQRLEDVISFFRIGRDKRERKQATARREQPAKALPGAQKRSRPEKQKPSNSPKPKSSGSGAELNMADDEFERF
jgi:methyl-accepting chemotaxis protein